MPSINACSPAKIRIHTLLRLDMPVTVEGTIRLLASTLSYSAVAQAPALRYLSHIPSCDDASDALAINVYMHQLESNHPSGTWTTVRGTMHVGSRGAAADVEIMEFEALDEAPLEAPECTLKVKGRVHKKWNFQEDCIVIEVNRETQNWFIG